MNTSQTRTLEECFVEEGASPEVAKVAAEAAYIPTKDRTDEQKSAIHVVSELIAENNKKLIESAPREGIDQ